MIGIIRCWLFDIHDPLLRPCWKTVYISTQCRHCGKPLKFHGNPKHKTIDDIRPGFTERYNRLKQKGLL